MASLKQHRQLSRYPLNQLSPRDAINLPRRHCPPRVHLKTAQTRSYMLFIEYQTSTRKILKTTTAAVKGLKIEVTEIINNWSTPRLA